MRKITSIIALLSLQLLVSCGDSNTLKVKASDFGADWMLTVSEGELKCEGSGGSGAVSFTSDGTTYAVNGTAMGMRYKDIDPIWLADTPPVPKKSLAPLLKKGLTLCK